MLGTRPVHPLSELPVAGCERDHVLSGALAVRFYIRGRPLAGMKPGSMSARDANAASTRPTMTLPTVLPDSQRNPRSVNRKPVVP